MMQLRDSVMKTGKSASQVLQDFLETEKLNWPLAAANYKGLDKVEQKSLQFDGFEIHIQFNPERMRSSAANVDPAAIAARRCFLCAENRPPEQSALAFGDQFQILVNPFPIFRNHFTVSASIHVDQRFFPNIGAMLDLAAAMEGLTVFYNGPECGASAPDHLHFQAGETEFLPVSKDFETQKISPENVVFSGANTRIWAFENYLRKMISIECSSRKEALTVLELYYNCFSEIQPAKVEPMMNVLCSAENGNWQIHLFPRQAHRPKQFFQTGAEQILLSPASVDFGGVMITPRKEDFDKITETDIEDILNQLSLGHDDFRQLIGQMKFKLTKSNLITHG